MDADFVIDCGTLSTSQPVKAIDVDVQSTAKSPKSNVKFSSSALQQLFQDYKTSLVNHEAEKKRQKQTKHHNFQEEMGWTGTKKFSYDLATETLNKDDSSARVFKTPVVVPEEQLAHIPTYKTSKRELVQLRRKEREKSKGPAWYGLSAPEMTPQIKHDLEILQMRSVLDPKRFYKKNDFKVLPKYFQIGKFMDSPLDFYNKRLTKKERKKTLVEELMANDHFNRSNKKRYKEIILNRQKTNFKEWKKSKQARKQANKEQRQEKKKTKKVTKPT